MFTQVSEFCSQGNKRGLFNRRENSLFSKQLEIADIRSQNSGNNTRVETAPIRQTSASEGAKCHSHVTGQGRHNRQGGIVNVAKGVIREVNPTPGQLYKNNFCTTKKGGKQISTNNKFGTPKSLHAIHSLQDGRHEGM